MPSKEVRRLSHAEISALIDHLTAQPQERFRSAKRAVPKRGTSFEQCRGQKTSVEHNLFISPQVAIAPRLPLHLATSLIGQPIIIPELRLYLVRSGTFTPTVNLLPIRVSAHELLFVGRGSIVEVSPNFADVDASGISIAPELFQQLFPDHVPPAFDGRQRQFHLRLTAEQTDELDQLLQFIYRSLRNPDHDVHALRHLLAALFWTVHHYQTAQQPAHEHQKSRHEGLFADFIELVNRHVRREHNIDFYAHHLCRSPRYMSTLVKQVSGRSAKGWIDEALATAIKVELRHTNKPLKQIADELAFSNLSFFNKFFKRMTAQTPMNYREGADLKNI